MNKRKPTIISQKTYDNSAVLILKVDEEIVDFQGHFSSYPLLPGVTQIDWAVFYGIAVLQAHTEFVRMEAIKFQEPILPDSTVELALNWNVEKEILHFSFHSAGVRQQERVPHSSGRIRLGSLS